MIQLTKYERFSMTYTVYMLRTSDNTLYTGITNDLVKRLKEHALKKSKSSKYMRAFDSFVLVHKEKYETKSEALKREYALKQLSKKEKEKLIENSEIN